MSLTQSRVTMYLPGLGLCREGVFSIYGKDFYFGDGLC